MKKILALTLILFSLFSYAETQTEAPNISFTDINGKKYEAVGTANGLQVKALEGKVVFLEFFGHKCPPCLASIPHLINLQNKHKDKFAIVSVEVQGLNGKALAKFAKEKGMNYIVVSNQSAGDLVEYVATRSRWTGSIPFMVALDKKGDVAFMHVGMVPEDTLEENIKKLSAL